MSSFTSDLVVRIEQGEWKGIGTFSIIAPFTYERVFLGSGQKITVPAGFVSDGCSIPWFARSFFPTLGKAAKAGVLHDYLLWAGYSKREAASIFLESMEVLGVKKIRRTLMYWSVKYWPFTSRVNQPGDE